eukprot:1375422-Amorphochlora_amoeboformis.AAC.1
MERDIEIIDTGLWMCVAIRAGGDKGEDTISRCKKERREIIDIGVLQVRERERERETERGRGGEREISLERERDISQVRENKRERERSLICEWSQVMKTEKEKERGERAADLMCERSVRYGR